MAQNWLLGSQIIVIQVIYKLKENFLQTLAFQIFLVSTEILKIKFSLDRNCIASASFWYPFKIQEN